jgi:hypothetical protein
MEEFGFNLLTNGTTPASILEPRSANPAGSRVLASKTLAPATTNPATPMERISLMGTVRSAANPIATVDAETSKVWPA